MCSSAIAALPYRAGTWAMWLLHTNPTSPGEPSMTICCSASRNFVTRKGKEESKELWHFIAERIFLSTQRCSLWTLPHQLNFRSHCVPITLTGSSLFFTMIPSLSLPPHEEAALSSGHHKAASFPSRDASWCLFLSVKTG